jgi:cytochrome c biogenesis protein CcdA
LTLAIPALAVALTARQESTAGLVGYATTLAGFSWLRFSGRSDELGRVTIAGLLAVGLAIMLVPVVRRLDAVSMLGGALVGIAAAALWEPCVGAEFGAVLDELPGRGPTGLGPMVVYLAGTMAPVILVGAVMHLVPDRVTRPLRPVMVIAGSATLGALALVVAVGLEGRVLAELALLSS